MIANPTARMSTRGTLRYRREAGMASPPGSAGLGGGPDANEKERATADLHLPALKAVGKSCQCSPPLARLLRRPAHRSYELRLSHLRLSHYRIRRHRPGRGTR